MIWLGRPLLLISVALLFVNIAWAIPTEEITLRGPYKESISDSQKDVVINYDMAYPNPIFYEGDRFGVTCTFTRPYNTSLDYSLQEEKKSIAPLAGHVELISMGYDEDFRGCIYADDTPSDSICTTQIRGVNAKGQFIIHVVTQPGTLWGNWAVGIECHYELTEQANYDPC